MSVKITGDRELINRLSKLEREIAARHIKDAVKAGAEIVAEDAEARAPRYRGILATEIAIEEEESTDKRAVYKIGPSKKAFWGRFQELGTSHHTAQPFLRPALDENEDAIRRKMRDVLRQALR